MIVTGFVIAIGSLLTSSGATVGGPHPFWDLAVTEATADDAGADQGRSADTTALSLDTSVRSRSEACPSARRAVIYYGRRLTQWRDKMGASGQARVHPGSAPCPRYLAHVLQRKAYAARKAYARWVDYQWNWEAWLPDKFARVGACETGYGKRPGSWTWDSGTYVSAFGIYRPAYEAYHRWTGHNTPREQYEVAAAIQARFGWGAWGCGGA